MIYKVFPYINPSGASMFTPTVILLLVVMLPAMDPQVVIELIVKDVVVMLEAGFAVSLF